jgi:beta-phosphoglucomutase-like phosphatase (HAD superfamily)
MKAVIFDFNGTLFIDHDKHVLAWNQISELLRHKPLTEEELYTKCNGVPNEVIIDYLLENQATPKQKKTYSALKEEYYRDYCLKAPESFHLIAGAYDYFKQLKKAGIPFTIASASIKDNMDFFISSFHLDDYIEPTQIVYDDGSYQNKVAMFLEASTRLNVPIEDCLIYEDSISGIQSAIEANCHNITVVDTTQLGDQYKKYPGVQSVIHDFTEVLYDKSDTQK